MLCLRVKLSISISNVYIVEHFTHYTLRTVYCILQSSGEGTAERWWKSGASSFIISEGGSPSCCICIHHYKYSNLKLYDFQSCIDTTLRKFADVCPEGKCIPRGCQRQSTEFQPRMQYEALQSHIPLGVNSLSCQSFQDLFRKACTSSK